MSTSYTPEQIATKMDQEGCGGCAEDFLVAVRQGDVKAAHEVIAQALTHINEEGYNDDQAISAIEALQTWREETSDA